jgi:hypothetical protein
MRYRRRAARPCRGVQSRPHPVARPAFSVRRACPAPCTCQCPAPCTCRCPAPCTCHCPAPCTCHCPAPCTCHCPAPCTCHCPAPCTCQCPAPCTCQCPPPAPRGSGAACQCLQAVSGVRTNAVYMSTADMRTHRCVHWARLCGRVCPPWAVRRVCPLSSQRAFSRGLRGLYQHTTHTRLLCSPRLLWSALRSTRAERTWAPTGVSTDYSDTWACVH